MIRKILYVIPAPAVTVSVVQVGLWAVLWEEMTAARCETAIISVLLSAMGTTYMDKIQMTVK